MPGECLWHTLLSRSEWTSRTKWQKVQLILQMRRKEETGDLAYPSRSKGLGGAFVESASGVRQVVHLGSESHRITTVQNHLRASTAELWRGSIWSAEKFFWEEERWWHMRCSAINVREKEEVAMMSQFRLTISKSELAAFAFLSASSFCQIPEWPGTMSK